MFTERARAVYFLQELVGGPLTLGDLLHSIRRGEDITQVDFARQLGLSRSHLQDQVQDAGLDFEVQLVAAPAV